MEQKTLSAEKRTEIRKGVNSQLRRKGKIPAIIYGQMKATPIAIDEKEFATKFRTVSENTIIILSVDGEPHDVLVKDYQEDLLSGKIVHIDFYAIEKGKLLRSRVPVKLAGSAKGAKEGGIVESHVHELEVECLPKDLPGEITVDITNLDIGHAVHIRDLPIPEGVKFLNNPDQVVVSITHAKAEAAPAAAEAEEAEVEIPAAAGGTQEG